MADLDHPEPQALDHVTRRGLLGAAGGGAATAALLSPGVAGAQARRTRRAGADAIEAIGHLRQEGRTITGFGYVTHLGPVGDGALFAGTGEETERQARVTFSAQADVVSLHRVETAFSAVGEGTLRLHLNPGGSSFDDPGSFARGPRIATFAMRLHNRLLVQAPDVAIIDLAGDLTQRTGPSFSLGGRRRRFGARGRRYRFEASGNGVRSDATLPRAEFVVIARIDRAG